MALCDVTQATLDGTILLYASPAWSGFLKADEKAKLQSVLNPLWISPTQLGYKPVDELFESSKHFVLGCFKAF